MFVDTKNFLYYWRLSPDGRMVFGGRRAEPADRRPGARRAYAEMVRVHPQLAERTVDYQWGGNVAVTLDRLPHVGRLDGAWYATGCNGIRRGARTPGSGTAAAWSDGGGAAPRVRRAEVAPASRSARCAGLLPVVASGSATRTAC